MSAKTNIPENDPAAPEPIAAVGLSCIFPQAPDVSAFWRNIINGVNTIGEPLPEWNADRYHDKEWITTSRGGYLKDLYRFNPREFGIMPNAVDGGEPDQLLALQVARRALLDAGERYLAEDYDHRETGIVLGHSTYFHRGHANSLQHTVLIDQTLALLKAAAPQMNTEDAGRIEALLKAQLPQLNTDIAALLVPNAMTGRIANRLNFAGPNYLLDAACASSLLAINAAVDELRSGKARMMLAGGVNASLPAEVVVMFTLLNALSRRGQVAAFGTGSDGTLLGEGLGVVVLKRLSDALADGDRVYAVIRGVGQSSDGKGLGLLAPSEKGETLAMRRAYDAAGIDPATVSLIEAHGTGIPLGDKTEIAALRNIFGARQGPQGTVAVGSVKSMISHCIPAAGIASFIKTCCALYHKTLPPMLCDDVNPALEIEKTPLYVNNAVRPWISPPGTPRRAGINSFGFGGVNAHAILEEAPETALSRPRCAPWAAELCVFAADTADGLKDQMDQARIFLQNRPDALLSDIAFTLWQKAQDRTGPFRLALIAEDTDDLAKKIDQAFKKIDAGKALMGRGGLVYAPAPLDGKLAFLFPGEGSQYLNMLADLAVHFDVVREWFDWWRGLFDAAPGHSRTDIVFPPPTELTDERRAFLEKELHRMDVGSEAVFIAGQALYALLESMGVKPDVMLGHSSGESSALAAARTIPWTRPADLTDFIRKLNAVYNELDAQGGIATGTLMAVALIDREDIEKEIAGTDIMVGMENCPTQTILYGGKDAMAALAEKLAAKGAVCEVLPFDRGYHTPAFEPMKKVFERYYKEIDLGPPQTPLYSCASAGPFPADSQGVRDLAARQWVSTVRFIDAVQALHADGVRHFVEVGPGGKLTSFAEQILRKSGLDAGCVVTASNLESRPGLAQFLTLMAKLYVNGKATPAGLFKGRAVTALDFTRLDVPKPEGVFLDNTVPRIAPTPDLVQALRDLFVPEQGQGTPAPAAQGFDDLLAYTPFITDITALDETQFAGTVALNVYEDEFLRHHILSGAVSDSDPDLLGLACLPLMVTLETMAEAAVLLAGRLDLAVIEDIRTFDWIALDEGVCALELRARREADGRIFAEVFNEGRKVMQAFFTFGAQPSRLRQNLAPLGAPEPVKCPGPYEVYQRGMFHGPIFQIHPYYSWNDDGIDSALADLDLSGFFRPGETAQMVLNPVLFDAHNQLTAFWAIEKVGSDFNSFPSRVERIELYGRCPQETRGFTLRARRSPDSAGAADAGENPLWDFECRDSDGNVVLRIGNMKSVYFPVPNAFYRCRYEPRDGWAGGPYAEDDAAVHWRLDYFPPDFCAQSRGIFLRIMAHFLLNAEERAEWNALADLSAPEKTRWLFQRFAVKEAVRYWLYRETGTLLYPSAIGTVIGENGAAAVYGDWEEFALAPAIGLRDENRIVTVAVAAVQDNYAAQAAE